MICFAPVNSDNLNQIIKELPFGGVQCFVPYDAFSNKYSICAFSRRKIKNPAARLPIIDYRWIIKLWMIRVANFDIQIKQTFIESYVDSKPNRLDC